MGLRDESGPFWDGDGLLAPYTTNSWRSCDNGVMYTSEYYILLAKHGQLTQADKDDYTSKMKSCMIQPGLVARSPGDKGDEAPDDYYGLFAGITTLGLDSLGKLVLNWGLGHWGSFNTRNPETWTGESFLWRQPQLLAMAYCAAGSVPFYARPLLWWSALVIATSCLTAEKGDADSRRLAWLLIQGTVGHSWACKWASKIWERRLFKTFPDGMRDVARLYYSPGPPEHPFRKYWLT